MDWERSEGPALADRREHHADLREKRHEHE